MTKVIEHNFNKSLYRLTAEGVLVYQDDHASLVKVIYTLNGSELETVYQVVKHEASKNEQAT